MKKSLFFFVAFATVSCGNLSAEPYIREDDNYVSIFDRQTFCGDCNFNLIRLYKNGVKPRFRKEVPTCLRYAAPLIAQLRALQEHQDEIKPGKKIIVGRENKDYFYRTFSVGVDHYLFEQLEIASTVRLPEEINTWNIPGEIIYFDDQAQPCEVEIGSFQYTLDGEGNCSERCFTRHLRLRLVVDHHGVLRCFTDNYHHLERLAVGLQIDQFLARRNAEGYGIFSKYWGKELGYLLNRYAKDVDSDFV